MIRIMKNYENCKTQKELEDYFFSESLEYCIPLESFLNSELPIGIKVLTDDFVVIKKGILQEIINDVSFAEFLRGKDYTREEEQCS